MVNPHFFSLDSVEIIENPALIFLVRTVNNKYSEFVFYWGVITRPPPPQRRESAAGPDRHTECPIRVGGDPTPLLPLLRVLRSVDLAKRGDFRSEERSCILPRAL